MLEALSLRLGGLILLFSLVACSTETFQVVFPSEGGSFRNPVILEASSEVSWFVDGKFLAKSTRWKGALAEGERHIRAQRASQSHEFVLYIEEALPDSTIRQFSSEDLSVMELPTGRYRGLVTSSGLGHGVLEPATQAPTWHHYLHRRTQTLLRHHKDAALTQRLEVQNYEDEQERHFTMLSLTHNTNEDLTAELVYAGEYTLVYLDTVAINSEYLKALILQVTQAFETYIYQRVRQVFGGHVDVDNNSKVILLFSPKINASQRAIGFFYAGDLFAASEAYPSNEAEILYLAVPDEANPNFSVESLTATACHELQHLVNFSLKTFSHIQEDEPPLESLLVNEGLSHLAEDICGYNLAGGNLLFVEHFLQDPHGINIVVDGQIDSPEKRGAAYLLLRYAFEQAGGMSFAFSELEDAGGMNYLHSLAATNETGWQNVATNLDMSLAELLYQWHWAMMLADRPQKQGLPSYNPRLFDPQTQTWQGIDLYAGELLMPQGIKVHLQGINMLAFGELERTNSQAFFEFYLNNPTTLEVLPDRQWQLLKLEE